MKRMIFLCFLTLLLCIPWPGIAGKPVKVEVLFMNHGPLQASLEEIRNVFSQYKGKIVVSWYDFESKEGEDFMAKKRLTQHIPLAIWMDDQLKFKVDDKEVIFAGFPTGSGPAFFQGKWTTGDLRRVLDQLTGKK
ncbi:MAG: hypothetical protein NTY64_13925 [Deltaproteobacteria bacterium]|nr:hypothetical protein [Deltaproteobacteria bacterium]